MDGSGTSASHKVYNAAKSGKVISQKETLVITDLPTSITAHIISRLSVRRIFNCFCVCKSWLDVSKSPECAGSVCPIIKTVDPFTYESLYLFDPENDQEYDLWNCGCLLGFTTGGNHAHLSYDAKFNLPVYRYANISDHKESTTLGTDPVDGGQENECVNMEDSNLKYNLANSCNGLLLLCERIGNNPLLICNPVTGEYLILPETSRPEGNSELFCGLGYNPNSKEYKVITYMAGSRKAELLDVGSGTWKNLEISASYMLTKGQNSPTYFCGALHWLHDVSGSKEIVVFVVGGEKFIVFPLPECMTTGDIVATSMGVLREDLYVCNILPNHTLELWVMKKYGVTKSWTMELSIRNEGLCRCLSDSFQLIKYMDNGAVLMIMSPTCLIYYNMSTSGYKCLKFRDHSGSYTSIYEGISLVPSFIPLKDSFTGCFKGEIQSVKSRPANMGTPEMSAEPYMVEDERPIIELTDDEDELSDDLEIIL